MECTIVKQGDMIRRDITLTYKKTHAVVDLTGCTAYSHLKTKPGNELLLVGTCSIDLETGTVTVIYDSDQIQTLAEGDYGFDVRLVLDGQKKTIDTERFSLVIPYTDLSPEDPEEDPVVDPEQAGE